VAIVLLTAAGLAQAQTVVDRIVSPAGEDWVDMWVYEAGHKVFLADPVGARLVVYDTLTLTPLTPIELDAYLPDRPQMLAGHQGTGTLYVSAHTGAATDDARILIIDADTHALGTPIDGLGWSLGIWMDDARARLFALGYLVFSGEVLTKVDATTNTVAGSINVDDLMGSGAIVFHAGGINATTGEIALANLHYDRFALVDGDTMLGEMLEVADSRGRSPTWNPIENKLYITTVDWSGYFIYDRDTGASTTAPCFNDGTDLSFSQATNRVYSGAEVDGNSVVIDGVANSCQEVAVGTGQPRIGCLLAARHAYIAGGKAVTVLDEDTLTTVATINTQCGYCEGGGGVGTGISVIQSQNRIYVRNTCDTTSGEGSCLLVIDDSEIFHDGFESGDTSAWSSTRF
jgi:hypothetical protein